jgi:hypothetical protein
MFSLIWGFTTTWMWLCDDTLATFLNLGGDESNVQWNKSTPSHLWWLLFDKENLIFFFGFALYKYSWYFVKLKNGNNSLQKDIVT